MMADAEKAKQDAKARLDKTNQQTPEADAENTEAVAQETDKEAE
jgi:hypothetical protein